MAVWLTVHWHQHTEIPAREFEKLFVRELSQSRLEETSVEVVSVVDVTASIVGLIDLGGEVQREECQS